MKLTVSILLAAGLFAALASFEAHSQPAVGGSATQAAAASNTASLKQANRALRKEVVRALSRTKGLQSNAITVRVNDGAVTLEGTVPEQSQMELATRAAQSVHGVASVKTALTLSTF